MVSTMTTPDAPYTFRDDPSLLLLPAGAFAAVGAGFLAIGIGEVARGAHLPAFGACAAGVIGILSGYLAANHAEPISVTFDRDTRRVSREGRLPWRRRLETWHFDEVETVEPEEWDDGDGGLLRRPVIVLKNGRRVPMMANWRRDRDLTLDACRRAREQLRN